MTPNEDRLIKALNLCIFEMERVRSLDSRVTMIYSPEWTRPLKAAINVAEAAIKSVKEQQ